MQYKKLKFSAKELPIHFGTVILVLCSIFIIIPNLSTNLSNYRKEVKTLKLVFFYEREKTNRNIFTNSIDSTLILQTTDGYLYNITNDYSKFWKEISDKKNLNKKVTLYISHNTAGDVPVQLEIDDKVIYDVKEGRIYGYIILLFTIGLSIYTGKKFRNFYRNNFKD